MQKDALNQPHSVLPSGGPQKSARPDIFSYTKLSTYLNDYFLYKKQSIAHFSFGMWSKAIGFSSTATLTHFCNGDRVPKGEKKDQLINYLKLKKNEAQYFDLLVEMQSSKLCAEKSQEILIGHARKLRPIVREQLDEALLGAGNKWILAATKLMLSTERLADLCSSQLVRLFRFDLSAKAIKEAVLQLNFLGLCERIDDETYRAKKEVVATANDIQNINIQAYHRDILALSAQALSEVDVSQRQFSAITFTGTRQKYERLLALMRELENECVSDGPDSAQETEIYQFNMQLFPLTQIEDQQRTIQ